MRVALAVALAVLVAAFLGGEPPPDFAIDWEDVEDAIQARWPSVISVEHDPVDNFVTILVHDGTTEEVAAESACATVMPALHRAGSRALFAIYTQGGHIVASWNRCLLEPLPEDGPASSAP